MQVAPRNLATVRIRVTVGLGSGLSQEFANCAYAISKLHRKAQLANCKALQITRNFDFVARYELLCDFKAKIAGTGDRSKCDIEV